MMILDVYIYIYIYVINISQPQIHHLSTNMIFAVHLTKDVYTEPGKGILTRRSGH